MRLYSIITFNKALDKDLGKLLNKKTELFENFKLTLDLELIIL